MILAAVELPTPTVDPEQVRRTVQEVLARPEYAPIRPSLLDRVWGWALDQVGRLLDALGGAGGSLVAWAVILVVLAVVGVVVVWFLRGVRADPDVADPVTGAIGRTAADWAAEAAGHEQAGRWREALRCRYRELIAELAVAGLVEEAPGRTTGEYLAELRTSLPDADPSATALTRAFEAVWYGRAPAFGRDVQALRAYADDVRRHAGLRRAAVGAAL
ncbi:MAG: DUF4129 domain-containing protein [Egibacteraceae bacterium]